MSQVPRIGLLKPLRDVRELEAISVRVPTRQCEERGCGWATKHGKPYCFRHVMRNPHASTIRVVEVERAVRACRCGKPVPEGRYRNCSDACWQEGRRIARVNNNNRKRRAS